MALSLHTEYSYTKRKLNTELINQFPIIRKANKNGIPQLWISGEWAKAFAKFLFKLAGDRIPKVIEIHPPFQDYCPTVESFLEKYIIFEKTIKRNWPNVEILIENRCGTMYKGAPFLISQRKDMAALVNGLDNSNLVLHIALDVPQLLSSYGGPLHMDAGAINRIISRLSAIKHRIKGIHLWGKKKGKTAKYVSHAGDLDSYFADDQIKKQTFVKTLADLLDDNTPRYFVPEVNSKSEDLTSIIHDMEAVGFQFT